MTKQHTSEPWAWGDNPTGFFSNELVIRPAGEFPHGDWIADCGSRAYPERVANARRIVACVNACAGIPTTALEAGEIARLRNENAILRAENARLRGDSADNGRASDE